MLISFMWLAVSALQAQVDFLDVTLTNGTTVSYPLEQVQKLSFHTEAAPGDGTREHPFTVAEALVAYQAQTAAQQVWVKGVIVGSVAGTYFSEAILGLDNASTSNILIASSRWETSAARCIPVQLSTAAQRNALNLQAHPDNLYHEVLINASLEKYFGVAGLKSLKEWELGDVASEIISDNAQHPGRIEVPALIKGDEFVTHTAYKTDQSTERVPNFYVSYSPTQHHSHWVAFRFDGDTRQRNTTRSEGSSYPVDPDCQSSLPTTAFAGTGYDHGHLCASADRLYSTVANEQTFYMTNMSPQLPQFNRVYWNYYESFVQDLGRDAAFADTLYVVKGGTIAEGQVSTTLSCSGISVPVPRYYYMALLKLKAGKYAAVAFWMEHKEYDTVNDKPAEIRAHAISIADLESKTGIDFFPTLPDATEHSVEATFSLADWGL